MWWYNAEQGQARFASLDEWLHTDIRGWTLSDDVDDEQFERSARGGHRTAGAFRRRRRRGEFRGTRADRHRNRGLTRIRSAACQNPRPCAPWPICPWSPVSLAESTLIMIDCQNTYTRGVMELDGVQAALDEAAALLDRARSAGIPIIHIQHSDGPGSLYDIEGESGAIVARVAPREGEPVVVKNYPNSFVQTDLDERFKAANASNLVLAGFMTHMCVNSTAARSVQPRIRADGGGRRDRHPLAARRWW